MIYKKKNIVVILVTFVYAVIDLSIDLIVTQIGAAFFDISFSNSLHQFGRERICCLLSSKILLSIFIYLIYKYNKIKIELPKKYILLICGIAIVLVSLEYYIMSQKLFSMNREMKILSGLFFLLFFLLIILMIVLLIKVSEIYKQKQDIVLLELQNEMMLKSERDTQHVFNLWRSSIHDYKNKIVIIKQWLDEGDYNSIKEFIENEDKLLAKKVFYIKTGNSAIDAIINTKRSVAEEKGISFSVHIDIHDHCNVEGMDLVCILGNLIDNAIEANELNKKKYIEIVIKNEKSLLIIKVINPFEGVLPEKLQTTKNNSEFHGFGINNVKSIVKKYNGNFNMNMENQEMTVTVVLLIQSSDRTAK